MTKTQWRRRVPPLWWVALLWVSAVHANNRHLVQHRVRPSKRRVKYRYQHRDATRLLSRFKIPSTADSRRLYTFQDTKIEEHVWKESLDGDRGNFKTEMRIRTERVWSLKADATSASPEEVYKKRRRRVAVSESDQFVGQGSDKPSKSMSGNDTNSNEFLDDDMADDELPGEADGWNVTSEVEYGVEYGPGNSTFNETNQTNATSVVTSGNPTNATTNETIGGIIYQPIRIRAILAEHGGGGQFLQEDEREHLFQKILSPAMLAWSSALRVDPVVGNLTVDAAQLYDGVSCGPGIDSGQPSVLVPPLHFTEGIPDTDLILYLSLGFVNYEEDENETQQEPQGRPSDRLPGLGGFRSNQIYFNATNTTDSTNSNNSTDCSGANNTLCSSNSTNTNTTLVKSNSTNTTEHEELGPKPSCSGHYVAAASYCSTDQYDRPTAALLHLCIDDEFFEEEQVSRNIITVMHELGHALGFNSQSLAFFRNPDGSPMTPRNDDGDVNDALVECAGPLLSRFNASIPLPSSDILQFRTVRGVRVAEIVTPSVRQVIRNHFNCQELEGAELESGEYMQSSVNDTDEASCIGDHWERRLMRTDLMNPLLDEVPFSFRISPLTLAYFADSGWYQVDLSRAQFSSGWGRSAGCPFVEDSCITKFGQVTAVNEQYFCNNVVSSRVQGTLDELHGCSPDLSRKAVCSISQIDDTIPPEYQYFNFTLGAQYGGNEPFLDYCPVYIGFANGQCKAEENQAILKVNSMEQFGAKNSRCVSGVIGERTRALCLPIACVMQDQSLRIKIGPKDWRTCQYAGQRLVVSESSDRVICPDPRRICPTFYCQRDCLGNGGVCDYTLGDCMCNTTTIDGTALVPCGNLYSDDQVAYQLFYDDVAEAGSPLADYYYPTPEEVLNDDDGGMDPFTKIVMFVLVSLAGALLVFFAWSFRGMCLHPLGNIAASVWKLFPRDDQDDLDDKEFANKDIMIASMLVDMRVHQPQLELDDLSYLDDFCQGSVTETSVVSVTETESSGQLSKTSEVELEDDHHQDDPCESELSSHVDTPSPQVDISSEAVTIGIKRRRRHKGD